MAVNERLASTEPAPAMVVELAPAREVVRVTPHGELDPATSDELRRQIDELLSVGFAHLVIDLQRLTSIDAAGLSLLLGLSDEA